MIKVFNRSITTTIIIDAIFIIAGVILVLNPANALIIFSYVVSGFIIATGLMSFYSYHRAKKAGMQPGFGIVYGILSILIGIILILLPELLSSILPVVLGVIITISGAFKIQFALALRQYNQKAWVSSLIMAILMMVAGLFLIFNPFTTASLLTLAIGIIILVFSVLDLITTVIYKFFTKENARKDEIVLIKNKKE